MTLTVPRLPMERTWIAKNLSIEELAARKAELGLSVSVVLPARNEQDTIEGVVGACVELAGTLVDELVVIDGASTDATAERAVAAGARVHAGDRILPEFGPRLGKGDSLWRSLAITSGDILVFIDSDIRNPHPRFVYGLLGPLLVDPELQLVKAFYERPVEIGKVLHPSGGGRVTELLARPLLNLFWPELAGLVQPLSGEYAGRRSLLESLPFFTGYGVEMGMLLDTLELVGSRAIGQVDLDERIHRNQDLESLSRMAFGIAQVAMRRLAADGRLAAGTPLPQTYAQFTRAPEGVERNEHQVEITERPPLRTLPLER
jgi:glucosyl-3-phosphoglycerate synthase